MGTWIEFRCENRCNPSSNVSGPNYNRCESHDNNGPMELAGDNRTSILETLRIMEAQARKDGWKKTKYGWICEYCAAQPTVLAELAAEAAQAAA